MALMPISHATSSAATLAAGGKPQALRNLPQSEQIKAASGQFEAIIVRQLLQDSVGKIAGEGAAGNMYGYMLTDVLANQLTAGGGLGLGSILEKQLTPHAAKMPKGNP
jgi:peptidoglycan hydrolase FlgJ